MASLLSTDNIDEIVRELLVFASAEIFVYKVPPLRSSGGRRAEEWGLATPLLSASMRVVNRNDVLLINLYTEKPNEGGPEGATTSVLFATAPVDLSTNSVTTTTTTMEQFVEATVDSSRYFAIKCVNGSRHVFFGIGFRERNEAIDFKGCLQDYSSSLMRERQAKLMSATAISVGKLSLKEGEKIKINMGRSGVSGQTAGKKKTAAGGLVGSGGLLLRKPPPPAGSEPSTPPPTVTEAEAEVDDFGDFQ